MLFGLRSVWTKYGKWLAGEEFSAVAVAAVMVVVMVFVSGCGSSHF